MGEGKQYIIRAGVNGAGKTTLYRAANAVLPMAATGCRMKRPDETVERRYAQSRGSLLKVLPYCDSVRFYDNTKAFRRVAEVQNGALMRGLTAVPGQECPWARSIPDRLPKGREG